MKIRYYLILLAILAVPFTLQANDEYFGLVQTPGESHIIEAGANGRIYTGGWGTGFKVSTNDGVTFSAPGTGDPGDYITDIAVTDDEVIVTSLDNGIHISENNGGTFVSAKGDLPDDVIVNTAVRNGDRIIIGTRGHGFFYSDNEGVNWMQEVENLRYWDISDIEVAIGDSLVAGTYGGGFYRSEDNGESWVEANAVSNGVASKYVNDLYRDEGAAGESIFAAVNGDGVYFTTNGGFLWTKIDTTGLNKKDKNASGVAVMILNSERFPIASFKDNGIYYYDYFFEEQWTSKAKLTEGFHDVTIAENGDIYAITAKNGIYRSTDNGEYWIPLNQEDYPIDADIVPTSNGDYYYFIKGGNQIIEYINYGSGVQALPPAPEGLQAVEYHKGKLYGISFHSAYVYENNSWSTVFDDTDLAGDGDTVKFIRSFCFTPNDKIVGIYSTTFGDPMAQEPDNRNYIFDYNIVNDQMTNDEYRFDDFEWTVVKKWAMVADNSSNVMIAAIPVGNYYRINGSSTWNLQANAEFASNQHRGYRVGDFDFAFGTFFLSTNHGLYSSEDAGQTWSLEKFGFPPYQDQIQEVLPEVQQFEALTSTSWIISMNEHFGIRYTSNKGQSWTERNSSVVVGEAKVLDISTDGDLYYFNNFLYLRPNPANLEAPTAITPANGTVAVDLAPPIQLEWSETVAPLYQVQVARNETFTALQEEFVLAPTSIEADVPGLEFNTTYYWRVRSKYYGSYSVYSTNSFTTKLEPPTIISPKELLVGVAVDELLAWEETEGADTYRVQIATDEDFVSIVADKSGVEELSMPAENLENYTTYYWRAKAENELGNYSDWSEYGSFITILASPSLIAPANEEVKVSINPKFNWQAPTGADKYVLQVSTDGAFPAGDTETVADIEDVQAQVLGLEYQTQYFWRVAAVDDQDNISLFTDSWTFTTGLPAVNLISPTDNSLNTVYELDLVWAQLEIAEEYDVEISKNPDLSDPIATLYGTTDLTYSLSSLEDYTTYYWRVRGNSNGEKGTWSTIYSFRTKMLRLELASPADETFLEDTKTELTWDSPKGATVYDLLVTEDIAQTDTVVFAEEHTKQSFQLIGLDADKTYYWTVRGYNDDRTSTTGWSTIWEFTTQTVSVYVQDDNVMIGPNPVAGELGIELNGSLYSSMIVMDQTGRIMVSRDISNMDSSHRIDFSELPAGQYYLILTEGETSTVKTIIKK